MFYCYLELFNLPNIDIDKETILSALTDDTASEGKREFNCFSVRWSSVSCFTNHLYIV